MSVSATPRSPVGFEGLGREDTKVSGASLEELRTQPKQVSFVLVPAADARQANVEFPVTCNDKKVPLKLSLAIGEPPVDKQSVPVKLVKQ